jgi:dienelactone hydrolase
VLIGRLGALGAAAGAAFLAMLATACSAPAPASGPATGTTTQAAATPASSTRSARPSPSSARHAPAATAGIGVPGHFRTGRGRLTVTEPAHAGPAGERLAPRRLLIQLWYPLDRSAGATTGMAAGPLPLIAFGPGFMQCGGPYSDLLRAWASAGYMVAAVNFPRSDCLTGAAATESDLVNQPADMSYAITALLRRSASGRGQLGGRLDKRKIAISGQSDGGDTVAAIAANSCCSDRRVRAAAVLSGAEWPAMPGRFFASSPVPMLFTQGSADTVNPPGCSVTMYLADPSRERYYLDLAGADHTGPYWGPNAYERVVVRVTLAFFDRHVLGQRAAAGTMRRAGDAGGIATLFSRGRGSLPHGTCVT